MLIYWKAFFGHKFYLLCCTIFVFTDCQDLSQGSNIENSKTLIFWKKAKGRLYMEKKISFRQIKDKCRMGRKLKKKIYSMKTQWYSMHCINTIQIPSRPRRLDPFYIASYFIIKTSWTYSITQMFLFNPVKLSSQKKRAITLRIQ